MLGKTLKFFFLFLGIAVIAVWISNNYGTVDIFWFGYGIHTSVPVLIFIMWLIFFMVNKVMWLLKFVFKPFKGLRSGNKMVLPKKKIKNNNNDKVELDLGENEGA